jgi:ribosomal-protein-alanine N-acetyltransferase
LEIVYPVNIRGGTAEDISDMIRLERQSPSAAHWSEQEYGRLFERLESSSTRLILVADAAVPGALRQKRSPIFGFLIARQIAPEWELENILVAPEARRKGIATRLLEELPARAKQTNSEAVFLEVRESNRSARALYEKLEFQEAGRRKSYYFNPIEDAILYSKAMFSDQI